MELDPGKASLITRHMTVHISQTLQILLLCKLIQSQSEIQIKKFKYIIRVETKQSDVNHPLTKLAPSQELSCAMIYS